MNGFLTTSVGSTIKIWSMDPLAEVLTLRGHTRDVNNACYDPSSSRIISCSQDRTVKIWGFESGDCLVTLDKGLYVYHIHCSQDGRYVVAGCGGGVIQVWNATSYELLHSRCAHHGSVISSLAINATCTRIASKLRGEHHCHKRSPDLSRGFNIARSYCFSSMCDIPSHSQPTSVLFNGFNDNHMGSGLSGPHSYTKRTCLWCIQHLLQ